MPSTRDGFHSYGVDVSVNIPSTQASSLYLHMVTAAHTGSEEASLEGQEEGRAAMQVVVQQAADAEQEVPRNSTVTVRCWQSRAHQHLRIVTTGVLPCERRR